MRRLVGAFAFPERARGDLERLQEPVHTIQLLAVEPGARMACIYKVAGVIVVAEEQRAERPSRGARFGPPANHEFLLAKNLQLAPVVCALARVVDRIHLLRDETFPSLIER